MRQMKNHKSKADLLKEKNYRYHFDREIYYNKNDKKIFSCEWIEDHTVDELAKELNITNNNSWIFRFNGGSPSEEVKKILIKEIDNV